MSFKERISWFFTALILASIIALASSATLLAMVEKEAIAFFNDVVLLFIVVGSAAVFVWIIIKLCGVVSKLFQRGDGWFAKIDQHLNLIESAIQPLCRELSNMNFKVTQLRAKLEEIENKVSPVEEAPKVEENAETVLENVMDEFTSEVDDE